jgi:hypothetical protein
MVKAAVSNYFQKILWIKGLNPPVKKLTLLDRFHLVYPQKAAVSG